MRKDQYFDRLRVLQIHQEELERKWRVYNEERAIMEAMEADAQAQANAVAAFAVGGGGAPAQAPSEIPLPDLLLAKAYGFYYVNLDVNENWWIKIVNFETAGVTDIDLGLDSNFYNRYDTFPIIQDSGFVPVFYNTDTGAYTAFFIDIEGTILQTVTSSDLAWSIIESGIMRYVTDSDDPDGFSIYLFDGKNVNKFSFPGAYAWHWGSYAGQIMSDLTLPVIIYYLDKTESYLLRRNGVSKNIIDYIDLDNDINLCGYSTDFIVGVKYDNDLNIYTKVSAVSSDGVLLAQEDISAYGIYTWDTYDFYGGSNGSVFFSSHNQTDWYIVNFDGTSFSTYNQVYYDAEAGKYYYLYSYYNNPYPTDNYDSRGNKLCLTFYSDFDDGYIHFNFWYDFKLVWISKGVGFNEYIFDPAGVYATSEYRDGYYSETLTIHFASDGTSTVNVGIMTPTGLLITETEYTNDQVGYISSYAFGDSTAHVFDLPDAARKFYVYNNEAETYNSSPTAYWYPYNNSGGFFLKDSGDDANNVYILGSDGSYTSLSDLSSNNTNVYNDTYQYIRYGYSQDAMVLAENMGGYYKIRVLNTAGAYQSANASPNADFYLGRTVFTNIYQDGNLFVEVFSLQDGSLLYSADTGVQSPSFLDAYGDRIAFREGANVYTVTLSGLIQNPISDGNPYYAFNDMYWYWY